MTALSRSPLSRSQLTSLLSLYRLYAPRFLPCFPSEAAVALPPDAGHPSSDGRKGGRVNATASRLLPSSHFSEREKRLAWASKLLGRSVSSFTTLRAAEAATLIDAMKRALGQTVRPPRRRPDRDQASAYGIDGRRANDSNEIRLVDAPTLELLDDLRSQLGWSPARLDSFLRSRVSPVRSGAIRTLAEANRVIWALKNMLRRADSCTHSSPSLFNEVPQREVSRK